MEWARHGIVEAMKARFFLYRMMLNWFLWMNKLQQKAQFGIILGIYIGFQALNFVAMNNPQLAVFLQPVLYVYLAFAVMTWISAPLFDLVLRTSRFGRLALSEEEISTSNRMAICLACVLAMLVSYLTTDDITFLFATFACGLCLPPITLLYDCREGWPRALITTITVGFIGITSCTCTCAIAGHFLPDPLGKGLSGTSILFSLPIVVAGVVTQLGQAT